MSPNPTTFVTPTCALPSPVALSQTLKSLVIALATHTQTLTGPTANVEQHLTQVNNLAAPRTYSKTVTNTFSSPRLSTSSTVNTRTVLYVRGTKSRPVESEQHYLGDVGLQQNAEDINQWVIGRKGKGNKLKKENVKKLSFDDLRRRHVIEEGWEILKEQFVDDASIDWEAIHRRLQRRVKKMRTDEDLEQILDWLYTRAGDPFTRYLSHRQLEAMKGDIDGQMCGVGIVFNAERHGWFLRDKRVVIKQVVPGSPADEAGLVCGDQITAIDMTNISELSFDEATTRLLGKVGRKVLLTFRRENDMELSVLLHRRRFQVPTVSAELVGDDVCYVQIREFAMNTTKQMHECLHRIMKTRQKKHVNMTMMNGMGAQPDGGHEMNDRLKLLILDLRGNSGGLVDKAVEVARMFLQPEETVVKFVGRSGTITVETGRDTRWWLLWSLWRQLSSVMPVFLSTWRTTHGGISTMYETMVILVDSETASASELLACALRDNCKALIIGTTTFGKGSVQAIVPFSNGGGAAVTVARYLTPKDHAIGLGNGIRPDWVAFKIPSEPPLIVERLFGGPRIGRILGLNKKPPTASYQKLNKKQIKWIKAKLESCLARKQSCVQNRHETNQMR